MKTRNYVNSFFIISILCFLNPPIELHKHDQEKKSKVVVNFLDSLPKEMVDPFPLNKLHREVGGGYSIVFSTEDYPLVDILDILDERLSLGRSSSRRTTELTFLNPHSISNADFTAKNYLHIEENDVDGNQLSKKEFLINAKKELAKLLDIKEYKYDIEQYILKIDIYNQFNFLEKESREREPFKVKKEGKNVTLYNSTELDLIQYLSNRYFKKINVKYAECYHPLIVGNYLFDKIEINDNKKFDKVIADLKKRYSISLAQIGGMFKGVVYIPNNQQEEIKPQFTDYGVISYRDDFIEVDLATIPYIQKEKRDKTEGTDIKKIYLRSKTLEGLFEKLHKGVKKHPSYSSTFKKNRSDRKIVFDLSPNRMKIQLEARNLKPNKMGEEEFRLRVEKEVLRHFNIEKKIIDYPVYECTYDLQKMKKSEYYREYISFERRLNNNCSRIDEDYFRLNFTIDPKEELTLLDPCLLNYHVRFKKDIAAGYYSHEYMLEVDSIGRKVFALENVILPEHDIQNVSCCLKGHGINIIKTSGTDKVLIYRNRSLKK